MDHSSGLSMKQTCPCVPQSGVTVHQHHRVVDHSQPCLFCQRTLMSWVPVPIDLITSLSIVCMSIDHISTYSPLIPVSWHLV